MPSYGLSATVADSALDDMVGTNANDVQMHTGAPGASGTANVSSVTTREAVTWGSASGGSVAASNENPQIARACGNTSDSRASQTTSSPAQVTSSIRMPVISVLSASRF